MRGESWPAETIELLRKLWGDGLTAVAIGARLGGRSRAAVLGKVFRLRLDANAAATENKREGKAAARPGAPTRRRRRQIRQIEPAAKPVTQHKSLLELTNATCRWPHGRPGTARFFFCGAPEADLEQGRPYCEKHMRRAYGPGVGGADADIAQRGNGPPRRQESRRNLFAALLAQARGNPAP
jgi:GcrA cell cycle regulator